MKKQNNYLISYGVYEPPARGGNSTEYTITKEGKLIIYDNEIQLTEEEIETVKNFINNEIVGKEYKSDLIMDSSFIVKANGREYINTTELYNKTDKLFRKIMKSHPELGE